MVGEGDPSPDGLCATYLRRWPARLKCRFPGSFLRFPGRESWKLRRRRPNLASKLSCRKLSTRPHPLPSATSIPSKYQKNSCPLPPVSLYHTFQNPSQKLFLPPPFGNPDVIIDNKFSVHRTRPSRYPQKLPALSSQLHNHHQTIPIHSLNHSIIPLITTVKMQTFAFLGLAALAAAQVTNSASSITSISIPDNSFTTFLTQTDSNGVVTGIPTQPAVVTSIPVQPGVVTSQPAVATIPAGLPSGINSVPINNSTILVSVGSSTTVVIGGAGSTVTSGTVSATGSASGSSGSSSGGSATTGGASGTSGGASGTSSASPSSSSGAAAANKVYMASGALVGAGAFFVAFL
ncbi:hypothetical protein BDZ85DRAFT_118487 [Elsinoe ampelina]|uniref:Uncharacterized protein n=1 Tax=Elsinoe ampelina TaxID=302913 RepID=A0A6A6GAW9_9PEZI|nr:hypothetical protein BDZ85DRAFT_118487 [Elsinoe ampelina]